MMNHALIGLFAWNTVLAVLIAANIRSSERRIIAAIQGTDSQKETQLTNELKQSADALQSGIDSNKQK